MSNPNSDQLQRLLAQAQIDSAHELAQLAGVAERQIFRLQAGLIHTFPVADVAQLAQALGISVDELLSIFLPLATQPMAFTPITPPEPPQVEPEPVVVEPSPPEPPRVDQSAEIAALKAEYERLEKTLEDQAASLRQQWQQEALELLESWLLQWSAAANAAQQNPTFPAKTLVALAKPLDHLLEAWQVTPVGMVGEELIYNPKQHQLVKGGFDVKPGDPVIVQHVGFMQGDRLLHRAKVAIKE
jgi:molecular chaperone GrpE (heat shock protein)